MSQVPYRLRYAALVVWYKVLVTAFTFEHVVPVPSLLGYQTKQKVAARTGERNKNFAFNKYCKII